MAARANWTGQIRLSLVLFPVRLHAAPGEADRPQLHLIHRPTGKRVRYQPVVPGVGPVERDTIVKGYEVERDRYVLLEPEALDSLKVEARPVMDVQRFVPVAEIDPVYYEMTYFVAPQDGHAAEVCRVMREALRRTRSAGLGQLVLEGRERIATLRSYGAGLAVDTLRYDDEIRRPGPLFEGIDAEPVDHDQVALAIRLIQARGGHFEPDRFENPYRRALEALIAAKLDRPAPEPPPLEPAPPEPPLPQPVADLRDALRRSLAQTSPSASRSPGRTGSSPGRPP